MEDPQQSRFLTYVKILKSVRSGTEMHHLFIDFKAAYGTIDRTRLYLAAEEMQIPKKLINLITTTIRNTKYQIRIQATLSEHLPIKN
jgi:hypothetical protein